MTAHGGFERSLSKHEAGAAQKILDEMKGFLELGPSEKIKEEVKAAVTYFSNNEPRMNYAEHVEKNLPIGSGVVEAASLCARGSETMIKQRLCKSGMRWKLKGAGIVLSIKSLVHSVGRWSQFWDKLNQFGVPVAA